MISNSVISIEDNQILNCKTSRLFLDQKTTFQQKKNVLLNMAWGVETLNSIKNFFNKNTRFIIMNALVLSHFHCSLILLNSMTQTFVASLDQQLNWAIKLCINRRKFDSSRDLKVQYRVLPMRYFLDMKLQC